MTYELYLKHYGRDGTQKNAYVEPLTARYTLSCSGQEPLVFTLNTSNPAVGDLTEFDILEVLIRNRELGIVDFTRAFVGILRNVDMTTSPDNVTLLTYTCPNEKHILSWRSVLWPAGVANRSEFTAQKAETIMKTLVKYNLTADATVVNGRDRAGSLIPGMGITVSIVADAAGGSTLTGSYMGKNILAVLQDIAKVGGGDFSLAWQGGATWSFAFHAGQLGSNKASGANRVLFSMKNNTMDNPRLSSIGAASTVAASAGQGEGTSRSVSIVNGPDYAAGYDIETFVDARSESTVAGREYRANIKLDEDKSRRRLSFGVLQTSNQFYSPIAVSGRKTFNVGDLVLASYGGESVRKVSSIVVNWTASNTSSPLNVSVDTEEAG